MNELGFTYDYHHQSDIINKPTEHQVKHVYRYEGNSDPGDSAIVYGIASSDGKRSFAGFSAKTNNEAVVVLSKLCIENSNNECRT
jgi:hypothetical protein